MEANSDPQLIPKDEWVWRFTTNPDRLGVRCCTNENGELLYRLFPLSDLPNDLISSEDLERLGIIFNPIDGRPIIQLKIRPD